MAILVRYLHRCGIKQNVLQAIWDHKHSRAQSRVYRHFVDQLNVLMSVEPTCCISEDRGRSSSPLAAPLSESYTIHSESSCVRARSHGSLSELSCSESSFLAEPTSFRHVHHRCGQVRDAIDSNLDRVTPLDIEGNKVKVPLEARRLVWKPNRKPLDKKHTYDRSPHKRDYQSNGVSINSNRKGRTANNKMSREAKELHTSLKSRNIKNKELQIPKRQQSHSIQSGALKPESLKSDLQSTISADHFEYERNGRHRRGDVDA